MDSGTLIEVFISSGFLAALGETFRWWFGRGKTRVDSAKVVQGMALDLLKPLHEELARCNKSLAEVNQRADTLQEKVRESDRALSDIITWALAAKQLLDMHGIEYPPMPESASKVEA